MMMQVDRQAVICDAIRETLADPSFPDHWLAYEALARVKLPGPDYRRLLRTLHVILSPKLYVEIGVRHGDSLHLARPETHCIAIDPHPDPGLIEDGRPNTTFAICTSDVFFDNEKNLERARGFDLAFIDGDHDANQVLRDFSNLARLAGPQSIICLHDVIPMDARTATPNPETSFHTGDVWRAMAGIVEEKSHVAFTVACPPTGLGFVGRINGGSHRGLHYGNFISDWAAQTALLNIVPNEPHAILAALNKREAA